MPHYETRAVLAGAYRGGKRELLTHTVLVADDGQDVKVVCGSVKLDSLADSYATDAAAPPTCPKCLAFYKKTTAQETTMPRQKRLDPFTRSYMETALWSSTDNSRDDGGDPLDKNYDISNISDETTALMIEDCALFQERYAKWLSESGFDDEKSGHYFWLARNGHGAGFTDDDYNVSPEVSAAMNGLQDAAQSFGNFDLNVGDDGEIWGPDASWYRKDRTAVAEAAKVQSSSRVVWSGKNVQVHCWDGTGRKPFCEVVGSDGSTQAVRDAQHGIEFAERVHAHGEQGARISDAFAAAQKELGYTKFTSFVQRGGMREVVNDSKALLSARAKLAAYGMAIKKTDGEYRVYPKGSRDPDVGYFTDDLDDAVATGIANAGNTTTAEGHIVADFPSVIEALESAQRDGATHVLLPSAKNADTYVFFPNGSSFDKVKVYEKHGKWHVGARSGGQRGPFPRYSRTIGDAIFELRGGKGGMKENVVRDYIAVDPGGRVVAGPFKDYSEAKGHADRARGYVQFAMGETSHRVRTPRDSRNGISAKIEGHSLVIEANKEGREELADAYERGGYPEAENVLHESLHELFVFIEPSWIGALTDAPILVPQDDLDLPDDADHWIVRDDARVFWFPNYMVADPWEELRDRGVVRFPEAGPYVNRPTMEARRPSSRSTDARRTSWFRSFQDAAVALGAHVGQLLWKDAEYLYAQGVSALDAARRLYGQRTSEARRSAALLPPAGGLPGLQAHRRSPRPIPARRRTR